MAISHDGNFAITVTLGPAPVVSQGFNLALMTSLNTGYANGEVITYTNTDDVAADLTAGDITAATRDALLVALGQSPQISQVKMINVLDPSTVDYDATLALAQLSDDDFWGITIDSKLDADILTMQAAVLGAEKFFMFQSDDNEWLTSGYSTALSSLEDVQENIAGCFHYDDTEYLDVAIMARWLAFDPDNTSAPTSGPVSGVAAYSTALTETQRGFATDNDLSVLMPLGPVSTYADPGTTVTGRQMYEVLTKDWFKIRLREGLIRLRLEMDSRGQKIPVSPVGQATIASEIQKVYDLGVSAGHFLPGQLVIDFPNPITQADIDAGIIRATVYITLAASGRVFQIDTTITRVNVN